MEHQENLETDLQSRNNAAERKNTELNRLLAELEDIETQIQRGIEEQGAIIRNRPESDAQYVRLDELFSEEAKLHEKAIALLKRLKELGPN